MKNYTLNVTTTEQVCDMSQGIKYLKMTVGSTDVLVNIRMTPKPRCQSEEEDSVNLTALKTYYFRARKNRIAYGLRYKTAAGTSTLAIVAGNDEFFLDDPTSAIDSEIALVPTADSTDNTYTKSVLGNKTDAAVSTVGTTKSVMAYVKGAINQVAAIKAKTDNLPAAPAPKPTITCIQIAIGNYTSADLEAATKTVTATARPEAADYTCTNNLTNPTDARLTVRNVGFRLTVDVDSLSVGSKLLAEVLINGQTPINAGEITSSGAGKLLVGNLTVASSTIVRALPAEIRLWKDVAGTGDTVVSLVTLSIAYGVCGVGGIEVLRLTGVTGYCTVAGAIYRLGTGTVSLGLGAPSPWLYYSQIQFSAQTPPVLTGSLASNMAIGLKDTTTLCVLSGSVATDLAYINMNFSLYVTEY